MLAETHQVERGPKTDASVELVALANQYEKHLRRKSGYWAFKKLVQNEVLQNCPPDADLRTIAREIFNKPGGIGKLIENHVVLACNNKKLRSCGPISEKGRDRGYPHFDFRVQEALKAAWETLQKTARRNLDALAESWRIPLIRRRSAHETTLFMNNTSFTSQDESAASSYVLPNLPSKGVRDPNRTCLYDNNDLLSALRGVKVMGQNKADDGPSYEFTSLWTSIPIALNTSVLTMEELKYKFSELHPKKEHIGADEMFRDDPSAFLASRAALGEEILKSGCLKSAREYAKQGIPPALRPQIWNLMLQSELTDDLSVYTREHCKRLKTSISTYDLLIDRLIGIDARQCRNDDSFFVFEDVLTDIMMYWVRDDWIWGRISGEENVRQDDGGRLDSTNYLPNEAEPAYMTFRELYVRYFAHLHTFVDSRHAPTLSALCIYFESLLKQYDVHLFLHLSHQLGIQPVNYASRWIMYAFVGVLDVEQVLVLWDRMLGYDEDRTGLELFSVAAAALFAFRRDALCRARSGREVEHIVSDFGAVKIVPLMQNFIFCHAHDI